jgi:hypothetical protein
VTRADAPLGEDEVAGFVSRGFVPLRRAFSASLADDCRAEMWAPLVHIPDEHPLIPGRGQRSRYVQVRSTDPRV